MDCHRNCTFVALGYVNYIEELALFFESGQDSLLRIVHRARQKGVLESRHFGP